MTEDRNSRIYDMTLFAEFVTCHSTFHNPNKFRTFAPPKHTRAKVHSVA